MNAPAQITIDAPAKTWADYVAEIEARCADVPVAPSPFRPCRSAHAVPIWFARC